MIAEIDRGASLERLRTLLANLADGCAEESAAVRQMVASENDREAA